MSKEVKPISMPGVHQRFYSFFKKNIKDTNKDILDVGAGHGAFSKKLHEIGYNVSACDLFPEIFYYDQIECKKADLTKPLPYDDNSFDIVVAIEVMEHILDHEVFFSEVNRILRPGGKLFISTPNILSLKSRIRFLFSGFFYSFIPLDLQNNDGMQHVASLTIDQYNYLGIRNGFGKAHIEVDKQQTTSKWLLLLYPFLKLYASVKGIKPIHNQMKLLLGRVLFLTFESK
ncbi:MAG: class I SAM-dependent methyltransferase [Cyclobacteriaceae bacterium]